MDRLAGAADVDDVARTVLAELAARPAVRRAGLALTEGGGRRLRFTASDRLDTGDPDWCHIDAYDDVPLTRVVRTGAPIMAELDSLEPQFPALVARQREQGVTGLAAVPIPGTGSPMGGLVLFYDGPQAHDDQERDELVEAARRTAQALDRVRAAQVRTLPDRAEEDGEFVASTVVAPEAQAVGEARRFLRRRLDDWGVEDDCISTAQLCLSELVTNAVVHAGTASEVVVRLEEDAVRVVVRDHGGHGRPGATHPSDDPDVLRVHGRGLQLVEALTSRWGTERDAVGTTVWFDVAIAGSGERAPTGS